MWSSWSISSLNLYTFNQEYKQKSSVEFLVHLFKEMGMVTSTSKRMGGPTLQIKRDVDASSLLHYLYSKYMKNMYMLKRN